VTQLTMTLPPFSIKLCFSSLFFTLGRGSTFGSKGLFFWNLAFLHMVYGDVLLRLCNSVKRFAANWAFEFLRFIAV